MKKLRATFDVIMFSYEKQKYLEPENFKQDRSIVRNTAVQVRPFILMFCVHAE